MFTASRCRVFAHRKCSLTPTAHPARSLSPPPLSKISSDAWSLRHQHQHNASRAADTCCARPCNAMQACKQGDHALSASTISSAVLWLEAGFWPVTRLPSRTACTCQFSGLLSYRPPSSCDQKRGRRKTDVDVGPMRAWVFVCVHKACAHAGGGWSHTRGTAQEAIKGDHPRPARCSPLLSHPSPSPLPPFLLLPSPSP